MPPPPELRAAWFQTLRVQSSAWVFSDSCAFGRQRLEAGSAVRQLWNNPTGRRLPHPHEVGRSFIGKGSVNDSDSSAGLGSVAGRATFRSRRAAVQSQPSRHGSNGVIQCVFDRLTSARSWLSLFWSEVSAVSAGRRNQVHVVAEEALAGPQPRPLQARSHAESRQGRSA